MNYSGLVVVDLESQVEFLMSHWKSHNKTHYSGCVSVPLLISLFQNMSMFNKLTSENLCTEAYTPGKINMEPENGPLEDNFPL